MGGMYADACGCMRMCAYVRRKCGRCGREMGTQRQMEDADGGRSRSGRWEPRRVIAAISLAVQEMMVIGQECTC